MIGIVNKLYNYIFIIMPTKLNEIFGTKITFNNIFHQNNVYISLEIIVASLAMMFLLISVILLSINTYRINHRDRYDSVSDLFKYEPKMHISWFLTIFFFMLSIFFEFMYN